MIGGISIVLILGVINFLLILFQLSSGLRLIKVSVLTHRKTGITLLISAFLHALLGSSYNDLSLLNLRIEFYYTFKVRPPFSIYCTSF